MTDRNAAPPQDADRKSGDGSQDGQRPLRPAMVMAIRGDDGGVSPKIGPTKGMYSPQKTHIVIFYMQGGRDRAVRNSECFLFAKLYSYLLLVSLEGKELLY